MGEIESGFGDFKEMVWVGTRIKINMSIKGGKLSYKGKSCYETVRIAIVPQETGFARKFSVFFHCVNHDFQV